MSSRQLTHDERKAAEAAFRGLPLDPAWSHAAQRVYAGLTKALHREPSDVSIAGPVGSSSVEIDVDQVPGEQRPATPARLLNRQEAIDAGIVIDVSPIAEQVGLRLSVGISKPLWEMGITASGQVSEAECRSRVREVLIALRLFIEQAEITAPWITFPALLAIPPEAEPQLCSLVAIAHRDATAPQAVTLLLPDEMSGLSLA